MKRLAGPAHKKLAERRSCACSHLRSHPAPRHHAPTLPPLPHPGPKTVERFRDLACQAPAIIGELASSPDSFNSCPAYQYHPNVRYGPKRVAPTLLAT